MQGLFANYRAWSERAGQRSWGDALVVYRRCWASQVIDLIDLQQDRIDNIVTD